MTYLLDDLEAARLIERRPDPTDRRARRLVATQLGTALLATLNDRLRSRGKRQTSQFSPAHSFGSHAVNGGRETGHAEGDGGRAATEQAFYFCLVYAVCG